MDKESELFVTTGLEVIGVISLGLMMLKLLPIALIGSAAYFLIKEKEQLEKKEQEEISCQHGVPQK